MSLPEFTYVLVRNEDCQWIRDDYWGRSRIVLNIYDYLLTKGCRIQFRDTINNEIVKVANLHVKIIFTCIQNYYNPKLENNTFQSEINLTPVYNKETGWFDLHFDNPESYIEGPFDSFSILTDFKVKEKFQTVLIFLEIPNIKRIRDGNYWGYEPSIYDSVISAINIENCFDILKKKYKLVPVSVEINEKELLKFFKEKLENIRNNFDIKIYNGFYWIEFYKVQNEILLNEEENEAECPICLENYSNKENIVTTNCNHSFCKSCLEKWKTKNTNSTCPICRRFLTN